MNNDFLPVPKIVIADSEYHIVNSSFVIENGTLFVPFPCEESSSCSPYRIKFKPGLYQVSLYGASGGDIRSTEKGIYEGGKGGLVKALLSFAKYTEAFLFIGGQGHDKWTENKEGGFNGGGYAVQNRGSGGGATDIRLHRNDYSSRLLVAGAGGGAFLNDDDLCSWGGNGGGLEGEVGEVDHDRAVGDFPCYGTQTTCFVPDGKRTSNRYHDGRFGEGSDEQFGAGGAGWWGGGSANGYGGAGGSSYFGSLPYGETHKGVNKGNGYALIKTLSLFQPNTCKTSNHLYPLPFIFFLIILK